MALSNSRWSASATRRSCSSSYRFCLVLSSRSSATATALSRSWSADEKPVPCALPPPPPPRAHPPLAAPPTSRRARPPDGAPRAEEEASRAEEEDPSSTISTSSSSSSRCCLFTATLPSSFPLECPASCFPLPGESLVRSIASWEREVRSMLSPSPPPEAIRRFAGFHPPSTDAPP